LCPLELVKAFLDVGDAIASKDLRCIRFMGTIDLFQLFGSSLFSCGRYSEATLSGSTSFCATQLWPNKIEASKTIATRIFALRPKMRKVSQDNVSPIQARWKSV
jgi:hypothetical protein